MRKPLITLALVSALSATACATPVDGKPAAGAAPAEAAKETLTPEAAAELMRRGQAEYDAGRQEEGLALLERAAAAGDAKANALLGWLYANTPEGLPKVDFDKALQYYQRAAAAGDADAAYNIAVHYTHGLGVARDPATALAWFMRAAEMGNRAAFSSIGMFHETGTTVPVDLAVARDWYRRGAEAGDPASMFNYGQFLLRGTGGGTDAKAGRGWIEKAAAAGEPTAKQALEELDAKRVESPAGKG